MNERVSRGQLSTSSWLAGLECLITYIVTPDMMISCCSCWYCWYWRLA